MIEHIFDTPREEADCDVVVINATGSQTGPEHAIYCVKASLRDNDVTELIAPWHQYKV